MGCVPCSARKCCGCKSCAEGRRPNRAFNPNDNSSNATFMTGLRRKVKLQVDESDDFLSHHLINELSISGHASSHKIRARQIIEHYMFSEINRAKDTGQVSTSKLTEFALKSWFQRTFSEAIQKAEQSFLAEKIQKHKVEKIQKHQVDQKYKKVREQLCQEYIFQIYQMGEFINAGFSRFSTADRHIEIPLSLVLLNSDSALYPLLVSLQTKYPLVDEKAAAMEFPTVPDLKNRPNILKYFNSKSYADPDRLNAQTLMDDLKFIIDEANDLKHDFAKDMKELIGSQSSQFDCKVKRLQGEDAGFYKAQAVRRVFIKWAQTLIEQIPDVYKLNQFVDFIKSKKKVAEEFIFKGVVCPSTHQRVIECLAQLLQSLKYQNGTKNIRQDFGLYIYDFLRCKTTRNTPQEVIKVLNKLMNTNTTKSGKRFQVVRIKNRFKKITRDLLINFRYGEHIIGEVQLAVDTSHQSDNVSRRIKFGHMFYELKRGLFGPTFQMIMLLQDKNRKDIKVNLRSQGPIKKRNLQIDANNKIQLAERKCPQDHQMIELTNNIFADQKITGIVENTQEFTFCDFCFNKFNFNQPYHYCYYCSIFYCTFCLNTFQKTDRKNLQLLGTNHDKLRVVENPKHLQTICDERKSAIVVFYRPNTSASMLFLDQIAYLISAFISLSKPLPQVYILNVSKKDFQPLLEQLKINRTPTTAIFNSKMKIQVTIIGASFHDIESLLKVKDKIAKGQPKGLSLKCTECHSNMSAKVREDSNKNKCQICMDTSKIEDLKDAFREFFNQTSDFICKAGHVRCSYCSYLSSDRPSYYRDYTGRTYLSNKFVSQPSICNKDHDMQSVAQPNEYTCGNCNRKYKGNPDESISYCKECKVHMCIQCEQTDTENYKEKHYKSLLLKQVEIVNHFVENRLEESYPCGCGKYFLKVYSSRRLNNQIKIANAFKQFMNEGGIPWSCAICKKEEVRLRLHLACFYCSYAQRKTGKPAHTQICFDCALKSRLVPHQPEKKVDEQVTKLKCAKGHQVILTSRRKGNQLFYDCSSCHRSFYPHTARYECRDCNLKYCRDCSDKNLMISTIFTADRCANSHALTFERSEVKLEFCKKCSIHLRGPHFICTDHKCSTLYCLGCISGDYSRK